MEERDDQKKQRDPEKADRQNAVQRAKNFGHRIHGAACNRGTRRWGKLRVAGSYGFDSRAECHEHFQD
ncbi:hypothetical protein [Rhodothermus marinus]|uniref:hypothetical protein n=1 Tax=Rhodothermus marinus TaxID=29549 RepID=UPI001FB2C5F8|nr:hypothetical protein [Rhodothermus marinus]